jgi:fatty acid desaturase
MVARAARATAVAAKPIDEAIRTIPTAWFKPDPRIYWTDMLLSAAAGWTAFVLAVRAGTVWGRGALLIVAAFALYRAVLFIHELTHLALHELPVFRTAWNVVVGIPLLLPSFLYEGVHTDHHRQRSYGTPGDPEYVPFGRRPPIVMASYAIASVFLPLALAFRFAVLAPLSWVLPPLRRVTIERFSALVINHQYVRRVPLDRSARAQEVLAFAFVWTAIGLWAVGIVPAAAFGCWYLITTLAASVNVVRTLASHRYDHDLFGQEGRDGQEGFSRPSRPATLTMTEQLLDSCTIRPAGGLLGTVATTWRELWAPVGLRYHALHHWIPSLPYHNLGRAHRLLLSALGNDTPYVATQYPAMAAILIDLVQRARRYTS